VLSNVRPNQALVECLRMEEQEAEGEILVWRSQGGFSLWEDIEVLMLRGKKRSQKENLRRGGKRKRLTQPAFEKMSASSRERQDFSS